MKAKARFARKVADNAYKIAEEELGPVGRVLSHNIIMKSGSVKNANVCTKGGKIWHGDLYLNEDTCLLLQRVADRTRQKIFVLKERDGRFFNEANPRLKASVANFVPRKHFH